MAKELILGEYILNVLKSQNRSQLWLGKQLGIHYKTIHDKINHDRMKAYDLLKIAKLLNIDLNELRDQIDV